MKAVSAPEGMEASRYYVDGAREWMVAARRVGETWWTTLGYIGHAHLTEDVLDARAEARVVCPRMGFEALDSCRRKAV